MTRYFLGVDIGSSKSHAIIATDDGECVGFGHAGPGNHQSVGVKGFSKALGTAVNDALKDAGLAVGQIEGAGFCVAGYDWHTDDPIMEEGIGTLKLSAPYTYLNDAMMGLIAGAKQGWGVSVTAGTSCNCYGRDRYGKIGRVTGDGQLFGEIGGGMELMQEAVAAVAREWSLRGPKTTLTSTFMAHYGSDDLTDLIEGIARGRYDASAANAPLVFQAIAEGDEVARSALRKISLGLADLACGVIRQLALEQEHFEVVMAGSFFKGSPLIAETMREVIHAIAPNAQLVRLDAPPVVGSVMLGMEQGGVDFTLLRHELIDSANCLLELKNAPAEGDD